MRRTLTMRCPSMVQLKHRQQALNSLELQSFQSSANLIESPGELCANVAPFELHDEKKVSNGSTDDFDINYMKIGDFCGNAPLRQGKEQDQHCNPTDQRERQITQQLFRYERELEDAELKLEQYQKENNVLHDENKKLKKTQIQIMDEKTVKSEQKQIVQLIEENVEEERKMFLLENELAAIMAPREKQEEKAAAAPEDGPEVESTEQSTSELAQELEKNQLLLMEQQKEIQNQKLEIESMREMFGLTNIKSNASFKERALAVINFKGIRDQYCALLERENKELIEELALIKKSDEYTEIKALRMQSLHEQREIGDLKKQLENSKAEFDELLNIDHFEQQ